IRKRQGNLQKREVRARQEIGVSTLHSTEGEKGAVERPHLSHTRGGADWRRRSSPARTSARSSSSSDGSSRTDASMSLSRSRHTSPCVVPKKRHSFCACLTARWLDALAERCMPGATSSSSSPSFSSSSRSASSSVALGLLPLPASASEYTRTTSSSAPGSRSTTYRRLAMLSRYESIVLRVGSRLSAASAEPQAEADGSHDPAVAPGAKGDRARPERSE
ncbi:hypothetical protein DMC30DRAFT_388147, partial [Rhodotorula diobovata]